jgi:hypothetical protein
MNLEIYKSKRPDILHAQDARTKEWYCKELPTKTSQEARKMIGELNIIYNEYNQELREEKNKKDQK